jgi:hypothetical protein
VGGARRSRTAARSRSANGACVAGAVVLTTHMTVCSSGPREAGDLFRTTVVCARAIAQRMRGCAVCDGVCLCGTAKAGGASLDAQGSGRGRMGDGIGNRNGSGLDIAARSGSESLNSKP